MAFICSTPLTARTALAGTAICPTSAGAPTTRKVVAKGARMSADKSEDVGLGEWLYRKFMHNALWEGDQDAGYEPFFKAAMSARDEEKKKAYEQMDKTKKSS